MICFFELSCVFIILLFFTLRLKLLQTYIYDKDSVFQCIFRNLHTYSAAGAILSGITHRNDLDGIDRDILVE